MAAALDATVDAIINDGDLLGRTIDTFVMAQLRPEVALAQRRTRVHHLRTRAGREEIDIVLEMPGGKPIGIEVKTSAAPRSERSGTELTTRHADVGAPPRLLIALSSVDIARK